MYVEDVGYLLQNPMLSARDIQEGRLSPGSMPKKFIKSTVTSTHANMYDYREDYPQVSAQNTASRGFVFVTWLSRDYLHKTQNFKTLIPDKHYIDISGGGDILHSCNLNSFFSLPSMIRTNSPLMTNREIDSYCGCNNWLINIIILN